MLIRRNCLNQSELHWTCYNAIYNREKLGSILILTFWSVQCTVTIHGGRGGTDIRYTPNHRNSEVWRILTPKKVYCLTQFTVSNGKADNWRYSTKQNRSAKKKSFPSYGWSLNIIHCLNKQVLTPWRGEEQAAGWTNNHQRTVLIWRAQRLTIQRLLIVNPHP
jgi:hypothetical protein